MFFPTSLLQSLLKPETVRESRFSVGRDGTAYAQTLLSLRDIGLAAARSLVGSKGPPDLYSLPTRTLRYPYEGNPLDDPSEI